MTRIIKRRADVILKFLKKPKYIKQVARKFGISQPTAKKYIQYWYNRGKLTTKRVHNKKYYVRK